MSVRRSHLVYALMRRRLISEGGFTLVEVMAALGIILTALLALGYTATVGFSDVALARQRQGANSLANEAMEQVRALPFDTMKRGLLDSDLSGDSNITQCGSPSVKCYGGEWLVHGSGLPNVTPLVPHRRTITVGPTVYTVGVYVTYYQNNVSLDTYRVTVLVTWPNPARNGVLARVVTQSLFFGGSGSGCLSTATHPFSGPCQPFLYGNSSIDAGKATITGSISGINLDHATLWLPSATSNMQIEQVSAVQGQASTTGLSLQAVGLPEVNQGRTSIASKADNDPAQSGQTYEHNHIPPPNTWSGTQTLSGAGNTLSVTIGASTDQADTTSAASALSGTYPCADRNGINRNDGLPCGNSNARLGPTLSANLSLVNGALNLGSAALVTIDPPSGTLPTRVAFTNRDLAHEAGEPATECPSTTGDGCLHADAFRNTGDIKLGNILSGLQLLAPLGWQGYLVRLNPSTSTASGDVGNGAGFPTVASSGTISFWNGTGYSSINAMADVGATPLVRTASQIVNGTIVVLPGVQLTLGATITQGAASIDDPAGCGNTTCTRQSVTAKSGSPTVDLTYTVKVATVTIADLTVHMDLGAALVQSTYQPAPSGA